MNTFVSKFKIAFYFVAAFMVVSISFSSCTKYNYRVANNYYEQYAFARAIPNFEKVLRKAFERFAADDVYDAFVSENGYWLEDYALYMAIKDALGGISWSEWPAELKDREEAALNQKREELAEEIAFYKFQQLLI